ncbi:MAG: hypothetical protein ACRCYO_17610, partial [Bacteroidia bacterium]
MASKSETGDAVNLANFKSLIQKCEQSVENYNPFSPKITLAALKTKEQACIAADKALKAAIQTWKP